MTLLLVGSGIALSGCSGGGDLGLPECEDGRDNDGDLTIDELDPACQAGFDKESQDPIKLCADGLDNDGDTLIDLADPGCANAEDNDEYNAGPPECGDGMDNDGDGKTDFPNDPGCLNGNQNSEADDCPSGPNCPACGDGADNDRDNASDYPNDSGCMNAADDDEFVLDTSACGVGTMISFLPDGNPVTVTGTAGTGTSNLISPTCQGRGQENVYVVRVDEPITMVASTDTGASTFNTVLYVREACRDDATELVCNDDISPTNNKSRISVDLTPGVYFLVVDARDLASSGNYSLTVNFYRGAGEECTAPTDCAPGYVCRAVPPSIVTTCEHPVCSDGRDDDSDGHTDYPADPGCDDADDDDETDDCPSGPNCPACGDGVDNDLDGDTDFPDDIGCRAANGTTELDCSSETDPLITVTSPNASGTTVGATNDQRPTCGSTTHAAPDRVHYLTLAVPVQTLNIAINPSFDSAISFLDGTCTTSLVCQDGNTITRTAVAPGTYAVVVDGWGSGSGTYSLNINGQLTAGAACNDPMVAAGVLSCPTGFACSGPAGAETCQTAACNDAVDADGDGFPGFPTDPGCTSISDGDETDTCPTGPGCPQCSDDVDNDSDTQIDYLMDTNCLSASDATEIGCGAEADDVIVITSGSTVGTTVTGATNSLTPTCGSGAHTAPERVHLLNLPVAVTTLQVDLIASFDAATSFLDGTCGSTLQCSDPNSFTRTNVAAGNYAISVDGWSAATGPYTLNVVGEVGANSRCVPALVTSGLLRCAPGSTCGGTAGAEICQPAACNDTIDADGDGFPGFPSDPGCTSASDTDETDDCPSGPMCPACANDLDDDTDTLTDYPTDFGCGSANSNTETSCQTETDPLIVITAPNTSGTTVGASNSLSPTCGSGASHTAPERAHVLNLRVPVPNLAITLTAGFDAATSLLDSSCGTTVQCADANAFTRTNVPAGGYIISVDGWGTASGAYTLNVRGDLAVGGACSDPLVAAGVLLCPTGYACSGTAGAETCQPAACSDTIDADGDGFPGFPSDPGCTSISDGDETDNCPSGPGCPQCSDDLDNDGDTVIDYPADVGCIAASDNTEVSCGAETDDVIVITSGSTAGTTVTGATNSLSPTCGSGGSHTAPERVHLLNLPVPVATLSVNLIASFDAATSLLDGTCGSTLQCSDPNSFTRTNVAAGSYAISVDGWSTATGPYTLNVVGEVAPSGACIPALITSGLLRCAAGSTCGGTPGSETCQPVACNDTIDADGDGFPGFPTDPGCTGVTDNDETDDCPTGPGCPVCSNDLDDDGDSRFDYPLDFACESAAGTTEVECPVEVDLLGTITAPLTTGTTVGSTNNFTPSCQGSSLGDRVYMLNLSVPVATLTIDTEGSTGISDSVLMFTNASCGTQIACDDDGGVQPLMSLITRTNVAAGGYGIVVDTYGFGTAGAYNLNVRGTIASGGSCDDPLVAAGVLSCAAGTTCSAGTLTCM